MTPAQCRAARGLIRWNQDDLAREAAVSVVTVRNFENEKSAPQRASLEVMQRALEAAGVQFTNGGQPGVRMKVATMPLEQFLNTLSLYEHNRLRSKSVHVPGEAQPKFGFAFVYKDTTGVSLMLESKVLGRASWKRNGISFDPPLNGGQLLQTCTDDDLEKWVSLAYHRSVTAP